MKVIAVGGYPGVGKSTIMEGVFNRLERAKGKKFTPQRRGLMRWMETEDFIILGVYGETGQKFPGTDRLPMNVQPQAQEVMLFFQDEYPDRIVLFEGDRLFNSKMLNFLKGMKFEVIIAIIEAEFGLVQSRREERSKQDETWRKGRQSKVDNIGRSHPVHHWLMNNTTEDRELAVNILVMEAMGEIDHTEQPNSRLRDMWK